MERKTLCKQTDLPPGQMRQFQIGRRGILLVRDEAGEFHAVAAECAHQGARLVHGQVERMWVGEHVGEAHQDEQRTVVICPWHNYEFDVATGESPCDPERLRIQTYRVEVNEGHVDIWV